MSRFTVTRTDKELPESLDSAREFIFGCFDGFSKEDKAMWRRFWKRALNLDPGEMLHVELWFPRSGPFHRYHMAIEQKLFDSQERIQNFEQMRNYLKIGAGWVVWVPGAKGGIVPLPKSTSYAKADEAQFHEYHNQVVKFLRTRSAAHFFWPHLDQQKAGECMDLILQGFEQ